MTIDRDGFDRALANVIDNALQHAPPGSAIDITCGEDTDGAYVQVIDDGPGIPTDLLPRVFEPMVRADSIRNSRADGAGLDLTHRRPPAPTAKVAPSRRQTPRDAGLDFRSHSAFPRHRRAQTHR